MLDQFILKSRMCDRNERLGALRDRSAPHVGDPVLGHHVIDGVLERRDDRPGVSVPRMRETSPFAAVERSTTNALP